MRTPEAVVVIIVLSSRSLQILVSNFSSARGSPLVACQYCIMTPHTLLWLLLICLVLITGAGALDCVTLGFDETVLLCESCDTLKEVVNNEGKSFLFRYIPFGS